MTFEERQHMDSIIEYAINDSVIAHEYFARFPVCPVGHNPPCQWCFGGSASAFSQLLDPSAGDAGIVPRDETADV
jgi:hypothetical protein